MSYELNKSTVLKDINEISNKLFSYIPYPSGSTIDRDGKSTPLGNGEYMKYNSLINNVRWYIENSK